MLKLSVAHLHSNTDSTYISHHTLTEVRLQQQNLWVHDAGLFYRLWIQLFPCDMKCRFFFKMLRSVTLRDVNVFQSEMCDVQMNIEKVRRDQWGHDLVVDIPSQHVGVSLWTLQQQRQLFFKHYIRSPCSSNLARWLTANLFLAISVSLWSGGVGVETCDSRCMWL